MTPIVPTVTRVYQNHTIDSTRWGRYLPRSDDVIVATPYKSGTTWMQAIVLHLIFRDLVARDIDKFSPWLDVRRRPVGEVIAEIEAQPHRRVLKSHVPLDGLPFFPEVKYVVVGRDPRDVFMSLWNHYSSYTQEMFASVNDPEGRVGPPLPPCPENIRDFWRNWIGKGWFESDTEGYPFWSNLRHVQGWWDHRDLPNILFVHYNDLLADLPSEIMRVAAHLDIEVTPELVSAIADKVSFDGMKRDAASLMPNREGRFVGGARTFIFKGTNGRWRDVLTDSDLDHYRAAVARELTPDCAAWLQEGGPIAAR
jgi:aryl sulfotransferase